MPRSTLTKLRSTSFTCLPQVQLLLCRFFFLKLLRAVNAFQSQRLSTKVEVSDAESFSSTKHFVIEGWYTSSKIYDSKLLEKVCLIHLSLAPRNTISCVLLCLMFFLTTHLPRPLSNWPSCLLLLLPCAFLCPRSLLSTSTFAMFVSRVSTRYTSPSCFPLQHHPPALI